MTRVDPTRMVSQRYPHLTLWMVNPVCDKLDQPALARTDLGCRTEAFEFRDHVAELSRMSLERVRERARLQANGTYSLMFEDSLSGS